MASCGIIFMFFVRQFSIKTMTSDTKQVIKKVNSFLCRVRTLHLPPDEVLKNIFCKFMTDDLDDQDFIND